MILLYKYLRNFYSSGGIENKDTTNGVTVESK